MHHWVTFGLNLAIFLMGSLSAVFWFLSALVPWPSQLGVVAPWGGVGGVITGPLLKAAKDAGRLNKIAAASSGVVALLTAIAGLRDALPGFLP